MVNRYGFHPIRKDGKDVVCIWNTYYTEVVELFTKDHENCLSKKSKAGSTTSEQYS